MIHGALAWLVLAATFAATSEGTVRGRVRLNVAQSNGTTVTQPDVSDVLLYIPDFTEPPRARRWVMRQRDKSFDPGLLPVQVGDAVEFKNDEKAIKHNVFSKSAPNEFDVGIATPGEARVKVFTQPGRVDVFCDIHEHMVATIVVLPNHAFVYAAQDGTFALPDKVPAGTHSLFAWRGHGAPARATIHVEPGKDTTVTMELTELAAVAPPAHTDKRGQAYRNHGPRP